MDFFQNGFLAEFADLLSRLGSQAFLRFAAFLLVAVVALEMSRRIERYGVPLAILLIAGTGLYITGVVDLIWS
ncbi:MAG: hypothetical protein ACR2O4_15475 [Hyphomicrobiaceae bacterium]